MTPTVGRGRSSRRTVGGTCPDGSWVLQRPRGGGHDPTVAEATKNQGESFGSLVVAMATGSEYCHSLSTCSMPGPVLWAFAHQFV